MKMHLTPQRRSRVLLAALAVLALPAAVARGRDDPPPRLSSLLPDDVQQATDVYAWGWLEYLQSDRATNRQYYTADLSVGLSQKLSDLVAFNADVHYWDDNDLYRPFFENVFLSARLGADSDAILTVGKFNAGVGIEARNAWDRYAGTASLLFGALPQDAIGVMLTQPLGTSNVKARLFLTNGMQAKSNFTEDPSGGLTLEYKPAPKLQLAWTNWLGGGYDAPNLSPAALAKLYFYGGDTTYYGEAYSYGNWVGPRMPHEKEGTLYISDAHAEYVPVQPLTLQAEAMVACDSAANPGVSWFGWSFLANYDVTDKFRAFARYGYLADQQGVVTGYREQMHELTAGVGYEVLPGADLVLEYRHDFSDTQGDLNALSVHLVFSY